MRFQSLVVYALVPSFALVVTMLIGLSRASVRGDEPTATPTPSPVPEIGQGDVNCTNFWGQGGGVAADDALALLLYLAGVPQGPFPPCPPIGFVKQNSVSVFGDVNCDGMIDGHDVLLVIRHSAGLPTHAHQQQSCTPIGAWPAPGT
ncbi:MAG: hypothetical protein IIA90_00135 [Chloroflexi bacterium]|nr:hypothetical protein [Chloroflexota bacterium]